MSELLAPNGKPSNLTAEQYKLVRSSAFKKWFGDWENDPANASKVVDENGEPKIMYHSTDSDFNVFQPSWRGVIFFSYTKIGSQNASVFGASKTIECFLNCRKIRGNKKIGIYFGDVENKKYQDKIKKENFDAIYVRDESKGTIAVFESNQIKLADGTNTTFDSNNNDIRYKQGGNVNENFTPIFEWRMVGIEQEDGTLKYVPYSEFYLWIYDDVQAEQKLKDGIYEYPYPTIYFNDDLESIWTENKFKRYKGNKHIVGFIYGQVSKYFSKEGYRDMQIYVMTTKPNFRRIGVNQFAIRYLRKKFNLDKEQVEFKLPTQQGKLFISSNQYKQGGLIAPNGKPSNLNPEQYKLVRTPAFKKWFGDWEKDPANASKVVDENGEPLVCRHYSQKPKIFTEFTKQKLNDIKSFRSYAKEGYYFSTADTDSMQKVWNRSKKGLLYEVFLNVKNILDLGNENAYDFKTKKRVDWQTFTFDMIEKYVTKGRQGSFDDYTEYNENVDFFTIEEIDESAKNKILKLGYDGVWGDKKKYADSISNDLYGTDQIVVFNSNQIKLADGTNTTFDGNNPDIRFDEGGEIDGFAQQLIDIISSNPQLEKYQKYKVILKDKFGIDFDDFYKDDYYIENANLLEIKDKDDFLNYDKYIEYAYKIFRLRGLIKDYHAQNIEGIVSIDKAIEIGKKLNFIVEHKEYDGGSGNYASHSIDTITIPNKVDINTFIHEIGHHYDHFESKEYKGLANTSTYASSLYEIGKSDEVFAENFKNYFVAPNWLKEKLPMVYNELDKNINDVYKEEIYKLINSSKEIYRLGGEVNTGFFSQIWEWFGIKF